MEVQKSFQEPNKCPPDQIEIGNVLFVSSFKIAKSLYCYDKADAMSRIIIRQDIWWNFVVRNVKTISDIQLEILYDTIPHLHRTIYIVTLFLVLNFSNGDKVTVNTSGIYVSYWNLKINKNVYNFTKSHICQSNKIQSTRVNRHVYRAWHYGINMVFTVT